jgi:TonB family protein
MNEEQKSRELAAGAADFGGCLVEGSAADRQRGKKIERRAMAISIALESLGLTALVIAPMLARPAEITMTRTIPIPPYRGGSPQKTQVVAGDPAHGKRCVVCFGAHLAPITAVMSRDKLPGPVDLAEIPGVPQDTSGGLEIVETRRQPDAPKDITQEKKRLVLGHINPALLMQRVEPMFPPLARQIRKSGKVELHAVIATDGTIQSLEVVSGDRMFLQSAIDAVRQWRYKPTLLNGQPVEVDTFITVIYTLNSQ